MDQTPHPQIQPRPTRLNYPAKQPHPAALRSARGSRPPVVPVPGDGMYSEPLLRKWTRRAISIPALVLLTALYGALLPLLLVHGFICDHLRRDPYVLVRFHLFIFAILAWHIFGVLLLLAGWLVSPRGLVSPRTRTARARAIEKWYIPRTIAIAEFLYNMSFEIEGAECVSPGPVLLLSRHASILDTITPIKFLAEAKDMSLRIVQKDALLWDPVVDIESHRMPRAFVKRGTGDIETQRKRMEHLLGGIDHEEALLIFPEGSRFSAKKRERVIEKLSQNNPIAARRAVELKQLLPIRPAGTLAVMNRRPDIDVVFLAHTGLEGANRLTNFIHGALLNKTVKVKFWRVSARDIPENEGERILWLHEQWLELDAWIAKNHDQSHQYQH